MSDFITQNMLSGEWKSEDKIWSESEFCSYPGVSRTAVRDAIASLTVISVLRKVRGLGTYTEILDNVSLEGTKYLALNTEDALELMELRTIVESCCTEPFTERVAPEGIQALEGSYYNTLEYHGNEKKNYYPNQFRRLVVPGSKNKFTIKMMNYLNESMLDHQRPLSKGSR